MTRSVHDTLRGRPDPDLHGGCRSAQRLLAPTAAIWHHRATGEPVSPFLVTYDELTGFDSLVQGAVDQLNHRGYSPASRPASWGWDVPWPTYARETRMFNAWIDRAEDLATQFRTAEPFPLLVIDDFLEDATAEALLAEFPAPDAMPKSRDYVFGDKHELSSVAEQGPTSKAFYDALMSEQFQRFISTLSGTELFVDPTFHGGGFHQSGDGGFLDTHVDFNMHPLHSDWKRTLNVLLYLNKDWKPEYDGRLLIKNGLDGETHAIEPLFNRGLIMVTDDRTYHGFKRMSLPPGVTRKSIATYAYERVPEGSMVARTTGWSPETAGPIKRMFARHYDTAVKLKTKVFGSATAKNR